MKDRKKEKLIPHTEPPKFDDEVRLTYRNPEGYNDPTAFFALKNVMKKAKPRHHRIEVIHYD